MISSRLSILRLLAAYLFCVDQFLTGLDVRFVRRKLIVVVASRR